MATKPLLYPGIRYIGPAVEVWSRKALIIDMTWFSCADDKSES
jgi:hypothetical protein